MSAVNVNLGDGPQVLIPSRPPPAFTCEVALGECASPAACSIFATHGQRGVIHLSSCPGRPIRVSASIRGKTWEESEVVEANVVEMDSIGRILDAQDDGVTGLAKRLVAACRDRWALVKALVTGSDCAAFRAPHSPIPWERVAPLVAQRDQVFSALADMARAEGAARNAQARAVAAFPWSKMKRDWDGDHIGNRRPSEDMLERYVEHLIEQVGILGVSP